MEALEQLAQLDHGIDLVLLDVMMPRLDGFAVPAGEIELKGMARRIATRRVLAMV